MYNRFRDKQVNNALDFISTGNIAGNTLPISGANAAGCIDSSDCASGWACNGGICRQTDNGPNQSGSSDGCGSGSSGSGSGSGCGAGPDSYLTMDEDLAEVYVDALRNLKVGDVLLREGLNGDTVGNGLVGVSLNGKCLKTGCTGTSTPLGDNDACCGQGRCCRLGSYVQCFCGECPEPPQRCDKFCTFYQAANGESAPGCSEDNTCDECSNCVDYGNFQGTGCEKKRGYGPCWCEEGGRSCGGRCDTCQEDGTCEESCENCQTCYSRSNYDCGCGTVSIECCYSACDGSKGFHTCVPDCDELCGTGSGTVDPCAGNCRTVTTCTPDEPPPCPPKSSCRTSGTISAGGQTCTLTEICDKSNVPDSCGECDCNCEDDCPDCFLCGADGKCHPDPSCSCPVEGERLCGDLQTCCPTDKDCVGLYQNVFQVDANGSTSSYTTIGPIQWAIVGPGAVCGRYDCSGNTVASGGRNRMVIYNWTPSGGGGCEGQKQCLAYRDDSCNWVNGPFTPVLLSSTLLTYNCCSRD